MDGVGPLVAVMAHCGDAALLAGGSIAAHTALGGRALIAVLQGPGAAARRQEEHAARALGAALVLLDGRSGALDGAEAVEHVAALLAETRPAYLLAHWHRAAHPDHAAASRVVQRAVIVARVSRHLRLSLACALDAWNEEAPAAEMAVDITATWPRKWEAMAYGAPREPARDPVHDPTNVEHLCRLQGAKAGVAYAEGFWPLPFYGRRGGAQPWPPSRGDRC
jgi:LmbE family N-acetylglucosaminyl deacetylase